MRNLNSQLAGKSFSHANYGHVYNAIPGWQEYWNGNRPASTIPAVALSEVAQGNLSRLVSASHPLGVGGARGGGGQPPQDAGAHGSGGDREQRGKEITAYAQPFSPQQVEMYKTLAGKLSAYASTLEELNLKGATLADVSGEAAQVIKAAGKTYQRLEGQYSRAQRVLRYDELQGKMDHFLYREGEPLSDEESRELTRLQEQMVKPTGADVAAAHQVKGYIQDIFPVYAEREAAGRKGTRLPHPLIANSPLSWAAQIAGRDPGLVKEARQAEKQGLRLGQLGQKYGEAQAWYQALEEGRADAFAASGGIRDMAEEVRDLSNRRQRRYEEAVPRKLQYDEAMKRGDYQTAQGLWDELEPLNVEIGELKDQIGTLTPHVKEHVDALKIQTSSIRDEIKERRDLYKALGAQAGELRKQAIAEPDEAIRRAKLSQAESLEEQMGQMRADIKGQARVLGQKEREKQVLSDLIHEPQGRAITGLGKRPQTYGQMALEELKAGYSPQRLFWEFQNIQQMQYMAFMPMLQMRNQYLGEQAALGQASYALGGGGMPRSVIEAMASQANMSRASSAFGRGVDNSITMGLWKGFTGFLGQNEGAGSFLGAAGFDATSLLTAAIAGKIVGGPALAAIGKLAGGLGVQSAPYYLPAGGPGLPATTLAALGSGGGLVAGGLGVGLGLGVNEFLAHLAPQTGAQPLAKHATVGAYELGGLLGGMSKLFTEGKISLWDQASAENFGQGVGNYTGAVTKPMPVWVTKIEAEAAKLLGVSTDDLPFDKPELYQMVQMAAEDQGLTRQQIEQTPGVAEKLAAESADSITSGVSMSQRGQLRQRAIDISGYAPGTEGARMMSEWVQQGSQFERQQRLQAAAMVQNLADSLDFSPQQRRDMSRKVYDLLGSGASQAEVGRSLQQRGMSNQFYWSQAAYASGHPEMALTDEARPWMPKNQAAQWAIEDRRRAEDNARQLGSVSLTASGFTWQGGRQEQELGWERQKLDLEQEFWAFRRKSQTDDFAMQQKLFDFNIRQQRQALEWEEKQSHVQSAYYEKQYALNQKIFELQSKWQRQDFDKQEARLDIQRSWQLEDSAWNRESFQIQSGWQMEDLQRALRYASSGRERMDIRRQMERQSILSERKTTEFDREDARATTKYDWAKEDLAENRQRFEEMNELQRQQMELGREYWLEQKTMAEEYRGVRKGMLEEQIALQQEQNALTVQQFYDGMALADKQHQLETGISETKHQWAVADLALARERAAEDEKILGLQRETMSASYFYAFYQAMGYEAATKANPVLSDMAKSAGELADHLERAAAAQAQLAGGTSSSGSQWWQGLPTPSNPAGPNQWQNPNPNATPDAPTTRGPSALTPAPTPPWLNKGYAGGGYTGDGDESEIAGLVHRGDAKRVVPSGGALVPRTPGRGVVREGEGSGQMVELLAQTVALQAAILSQLQDGGGTILIDADKLKKAGFLHQSNFSQVYR